MATLKASLKVQVWVFAGKEVLLLKTLPERGGFWQPVTGSVEAGEGLRDAAVRELQEETGLAVSSSQILDTGYEFEFESRWGGVARERVWCVRLAATQEVKDSIRLDSREHEGFVWCDFRQAEKNLLHESTKKALKMAEKKIARENI